MASEHSGQGRRNRLLAALTSADYSLLAPHLKELSLELGSLLQGRHGRTGSADIFPPSGNDFPSGCDVGWARDRDRHGWQRRRGWSNGWIRRPPGFYEGGRPGSPGGFAHFPVCIFTRPFRKVRASEEASDGELQQKALLAQVQQTAACNALHASESRLARWLLQTRDRIDTDVLPLTQEFLSQMLGVRRTTVTLVARQLATRLLGHSSRQVRRD